MELGGYLRDGESPVRSAEAYNGHEDTSGRLALTEDRLVFVKGKNALDISLDAIDAIEYEEPNIPASYIVVSVVLAVGGYSASELISTLNDFPIEGGLILTLGLIAGLIVGGLGLFYRRARLQVYTPSGEFEFTARGSALQRFPSALRKLR
jgi:hypothetical protein